MRPVPLGPAVRLFVVAGEASGDALGAALLEGMRELAPGTSPRGVAGPRMQAAGATTLFPMDELSVMGIAEILPRYPQLRRRMVETADAAIESGADALVTIDSPDFSLRVAARVKAARPKMPVIHYVAPSVWAWRAGRAARMARHVDHVLALLPFEPPLMRAAGMTCDFVGHPAAMEAQATPEEVALFKRVHELEGDVLLVLPGSRRGEIARLAATFGVAAALVLRARAGMRAVVPVAPGRMHEVRDAVKDWTFRPLLVDTSDPEARRAAFASGEGALAASGTVSLDLAREGVPMVIGYDVHPLTRILLRRLIQVDTVTLVNLVSGTRAVPEFLGRSFGAPQMAAALIGAMDDPGVQKAAARETMVRLGQSEEAPGLRAARSVRAAVERLSA